MDEKPQETPPARIVLWAFVFVVMLAWQWPAWKAGYDLPDTKLTDFCQDWVSARFYFEGTSVYGHQASALSRHLNRTVDTRTKQLYLPYNAHPPSSILFVLPLATFPYETASRIWSLFWLATLPISFLIVNRALGAPLPWWSVFPLGTLLLWCAPLREEFAYGQFNLLLLLLIVSGWALARGNWPWLGGALLGLAAVTKLFPAFLFLPFLVRRDWRVLGGGAASFVGVTLLTASLFGWQAYEEYITKIIPHVSEFRSSWMNLSLPGLFSWLFHPANETTRPLVQSQGLYLALTAAAAALVLAACVRGEWRAKPVGAHDRSFGLAICGMLLLNPTTWPHYCLLLLLPALLLWQVLPDQGWQRPLFYLSLLVLWLPKALVFALILRIEPGDWYLHTATPWQVLTGLALHTYALVLFSVVMLWVALAPDKAPAST